MIQGQLYQGKLYQVITGCHGHAIGMGKGTPTMDYNWVFLYRRAKEFKSLEVNIKRGWGWWEVARWPCHCKLLKNIKFMLNILCINNLKYGHNWKRDEEPSKTHVLVGCVLIAITRGHIWSTHGEYCAFCHDS